jgi:hypothetical protein
MHNWVINMFVPNEATSKPEPVPLPTVESPPAPPSNLFLFERNNLPYLQHRTRELFLNTNYFPPTVLILFAICTLLVIYLALLGGVNTLRWGLTSIAGTTVQATLTDFRTIRTTNGRGYTYVIEYTYTVNDKRYDGSQNVTSFDYWKATESKEVTITYWSPLPSVMRLSGEFEDTTAPLSNLVLLIVCGAVGAFMGFLLVGFTRARIMLEQIEKRLLKEGRLIYGEVISSSAKTLPKGRYQVTVNYGIHTPDARWLTRDESRVLNWMAGKPLPAKGTPVAIYYAADDLMVAL